MEENEIPSTSQNRILHVLADKVPRSRMSFFAVEPVEEVYTKRKQRFSNTRRFIEKMMEGREPNERSRRFRSMWEHTQFGNQSTQTTCPNCLYYVCTNVEYYNVFVTHLVAICLLPVCMCLVPYSSVTFKDTVHRCPRCKIYLGIKFSSGKHLFSRQTQYSRYVTKTTDQGSRLIFVKGMYSRCFRFSRIYGFEEQLLKKMNWIMKNKQRNGSIT
ncbi:hypothetical protein KPH14_010472 [Odynerus spinipes]|uniref:LITAF domain-containing protein n=1 Tax=Odynerus spinipes TaxID=1348599 RepID=A0AAD9RUF6_9HYME|nr:hypothetical protein KPH14_010472 [Odynerus spinipes]